VARVRTPRDLRLLQLEDGGAWDAGSVAAIAKTADRPLSQEWARYFYAAPAYGSVDGLRFENAHNDEPAFAFFERAGPFVVIDHWSLADARLTAEIDAIALRLHLIVDR
jgi:RES domain